MKVRLTFKDYIDGLREYSNLPLNINLLGKPFGVSDASEASSDLLVGHLLDAMQEEYEEDDLVDALDAAAVALSLGYDPAEDFLQRGPFLIWQALQNELPTA